MNKIIINGPVELNGEVIVRGAKNATLPILIAAAAANQTVILSNVPDQLNDVRQVFEALTSVGYQLDINNGTVVMQPTTKPATSIPEEVASKIRSSLLFLGLFAGKYGYAKISKPGGCNLGDRKYDLHLKGLQKLGATITETDTAIEVKADRLIGVDIDFYLPTTSGTENIMIAACFAEGRTRIFNANTRPEVEDLGNMINAMGGQVSVRNRVVEVVGVKELKGCQYRIMSGWDEALTYLIGGVLTGGEICIKDFSLTHVQQDVMILRQSGVDVFEWGGNVYATAKNNKLKPFDLFTGPYPAVNSDLQPIFSALASQCHGESTITDQRFTERFAYVGELKKLGVQIDNYGNSAIITGPNRLKGNKVKALDLRCGAALLISALKAEGITMIDNCYQIGRGYEDVAGRLSQLGADIEVID